MTICDFSYLNVIDIVYITATFFFWTKHALSQKDCDNFRSFKLNVNIVDCIWECNNFDSF